MPTIVLRFTMDHGQINYLKKKHPIAYLIIHGNLLIKPKIIIHLTMNYCQINYLKYIYNECTKYTSFIVINFTS